MPDNARLKHNRLKVTTLRTTIPAFLCFMVCAAVSMALLLQSCNSSGRKKGSPSENTEQAEFKPLPLNNFKTQPAGDETTPKVSGGGAMPAMPPPAISSHSSYDDGYLDGQAAAEEDRLAGRPGMQAGEGEDDDEEYEEGYEDGYDDAYDE